MEERKEEVVHQYNCDDTDLFLANSKDIDHVFIVNCNEKVNSERSYRSGKFKTITTPVDIMSNKMNPHSYSCECGKLFSSKFAMNLQSLIKHIQSDGVSRTKSPNKPLAKNAGKVGYHQPKGRQSTIMRSFFTPPKAPQVATYEDDDDALQRAIDLSTAGSEERHEADVNANAAEHTSTTTTAVVNADRDGTPEVQIREYCDGSLLDGCDFADFPLYEAVDNDLGFTINTNGILHSKSCLGRGKKNEKVCKHCISINSNKEVNRLRENGLEKDVDALKWLATNKLSFNQIRTLRSAARITKQRDNQRLRREIKKTGTLLERVELFNQLLMLLSENKIRKVHTVIARALKKSKNPRIIIGTLERVIHRMHEGVQSRSKSMQDLDDVDLAALVRALCPRLLVPMANMFGTDSLSSARRRQNTPPFRACAGGREDMKVAILQNMTNYIFSQDFIGDRVLWHLQLDETVLQEGVETSHQTGLCLGICHHSFLRGTNLYLETQANVNDLEDSLKRGIKDDSSGKNNNNQGIHVASKVLTISLQPNKEINDGAIIIGAIGTCDSVDSEFTKKVMDVVLNIWNSNEGGCAQRGPISTMQSDGGSDVLGAGKKLVTRTFLSPENVSEEWRAAEKERNDLKMILNDLRLFPKLCGGDKIWLLNFVAGCDDKHVLKRLRQRLVGTKKGIRVKNISFTKDMIKDLLIECGVCGANDLIGILREGDQMNVPASVKLCKYIAEFRNKKLSDFPTSAPAATSQHFETTLQELNLLGEYCYCWALVFSEKPLNLTDQLKNLSTLSHLLFTIYNQQGQNFIASNNYYNTQRMVHAKYFSIAKAKVNDIEYYFPFLDSSDSLEQHFGIARSLHGAAHGFTMNQYENRVTASMSVMQIYVRHPEWKRNRRLNNGSNDRWNTKEWLRRRI